MKILILDDDVNFQEYMDGHTRIPEGTTFVQCLTYKQFTKKCVPDTVFDMMFLDHDLGEKKDGCDACRYIIANKIKANVIYVTSNNTIRCKEMFALLDENGYEVYIYPKLNINNYAIEGMMEVYQLPKD